VSPTSCCNRLLKAVWHRRLDEEGQALIEYALILALIALVTVGVLTALGQNIHGLLTKVSTTMATVSNP
jgi:pilus assembly protein Flp/PilA